MSGDFDLVRSVTATYQMWANHPPVVFGQCRHCGMWHNGACHRVKAVEYHPDGTVKRIEYHEAMTPPVGGYPVQTWPPLNPPFTVTC